MEGKLQMLLSPNGLDSVFKEVRVKTPACRAERCPQIVQKIRCDRVSFCNVCESLCREAKLGLFGFLAFFPQVLKSF